MVMEQTKLGTSEPDPANGEFIQWTIGVDGLYFARVAFAQ
jgi:hypothetical protein